MKKFIILLILLLPSWASAYTACGGTCWVKATEGAGYATWPTGCKGETDPGTYCSLTDANANVQAGDTVYLKGGTYTASGAYGGINPYYSGTDATHRIQFLAATGETPIIDGDTTTSIGIWFGDNPGTARTINWVKVSGITFRDHHYFGSISNSSSYNEIANCTFQNTKSLGTADLKGLTMTSLCGGGATYGCYVTHNWIHNNIFSKVTYSDPCGEVNDLIKMGEAGGASGSNGSNNYNTIENNLLEYYTHSAIDSFGQYTVIRGNIVHNEPWLTGCVDPPLGATYNDWATGLNGKISHRGFQINDDYDRPNVWNLVENNRAGFSGHTGGWNQGDGLIVIGGSGSIVRYNYAYAGMRMGVYFKYVMAVGGNGGYGGSNTRFYNNTIYHSGFGDAVGLMDRQYAMVMEEYNGSTYPSSLNVLKNNLIYGSKDGDWYFSVAGGGSCTVFSDCATVTNNWCTSAATGCTATGDPNFADTTLTSYGSQNLFSGYTGYASTPLPNLVPQNTSVRDNGTYLTTATAASGGTPTILPVADAMYFQDGTWGSDLARYNAVTNPTGLQADWVCVGTVSNCAQISSIAYGTYPDPAGTITLASPLTWSNGASVWLYRNSSGTRVLYGSAPDYGAWENEEVGSGASGCVGCLLNGARLVQ